MKRGRLLYPYPVLAVSKARTLHAFRNRYAFENGDPALCGDPMDGCTKPTRAEKLVLTLCDGCAEAMKTRGPVPS